MKTECNGFHFHAGAFLNVAQVQKFYGSRHTIDIEMCITLYLLTIYNFFHLVIFFFLFDGKKSGNYFPKKDKVVNLIVKIK